MSTEPPPSIERPDTRRRPVVSARVKSETFAGSWPHCQQLADFVARVSASDRFDAERHTTLVSNFVNEMLELVYRLHAPGREIALEVFTVSDELLIELTIPVDDEVERAYERLFTRLGSGESREFLRKHLLKAPGQGPDGETAFFELTSIHDMKLELRGDAPGRVMVLAMPVRLD